MLVHYFTWHISVTERSLIRIMTKQRLYILPQKFLTPLRTTIEIHEQSMSKKKWDEIDFQRVYRYAWKETEN
jgi:hypothetical protein